MSSLRSGLFGLVLFASTVHAQIPAPLGRSGDVVERAPSGGIPGGELVVRLSEFPGCEENQLAWLGRFLVMGAAGAGEQIQQWLDQQPAVQRRLFPRGRPLADAVDRARSGSFHEGRACRMKDDAVLTSEKAPPALCKLERGSLTRDGLWLFTDHPPGRVKPSNFTGAVLLSPPREPAKGCRPRLAAALYDRQGNARLRYHADFGGELWAEVLGDGCRSLVLRFDPERRGFVATEVTRTCRAPSRR